jgi:hypothetical protein
MHFYNFSKRQTITTEIMKCYMAFITYRKKLHHSYSMKARRREMAVSPEKGKGQGGFPNKREGEFSSFFLLLLPSVNSAPPHSLVMVD